MAAEEPEVRVHVELSAHHALAVLAAGLGNLGNAVEHQHRRQRQLGVAGPEQLAPAAGQQILILIATAPIEHRPKTLSSFPIARFCKRWQPCGRRTMSPGWPR